MGEEVDETKISVQPFKAKLYTDVTMIEKQKTVLVRHPNTYRGEWGWLR